MCIRDRNKTTEVGGSKKVTKGSIERAVRYAFKRGSDALLTTEVYEAIFESSISIDLSNINMTEPARLISGGMLGSMLSALSDCEESISSRALNDVMLLACAYADNRNMILSLPEFPDWLVKILVYSTDIGVKNTANDLLLILLQHSMRLQDGWRVLEMVIESMKNVSKNDSKKMIHVQETIFQGLAGFMISELKGISVSDGNQSKKSRETLDANRTTTRQNVIALLHMAEEHLRLSSGDVLSNVDDSYDLMNVSNALACYGSHAADSASGWINRNRAIDGLASVNSSVSDGPNKALELLRLTHQIISFMVGTQCTGARSNLSLLKDDELVHLFLRLTLAYFREENLPAEQESPDNDVPLMPAHIVNTLSSLTSGNSSISDAIVFESKQLWGASQSSESGRNIAVLHNLLAPFLQAASVRHVANLAPGAIALLLDEVWIHQKLKKRNTGLLRPIVTYLIALTARWRAVIVDEGKDDISPK